MPMPYDAVTKHLIDLHPADWLALLGHPGADGEPMDVDLLDSDLSTVTSQADRVLRINAPVPSLQHIELETGHHGAESPKKLLRFSVLFSAKHDLPVESAIVLLRREADSPALTGRLQFRRRSGEVYLTFEYTVVRVWELSVESLLSGGMGTLPLAPLANVTLERLPEVVSRMQQRLSTDVKANFDEGEFWTSTNILLGLRYPELQVSELLKGVRHMKESATYQAILAEGEARGEARGRADEARRMLRLACEGRLGEPSPTISAALASIDSLDRLEFLARRLFKIETWDELLAEA